MEPKETAHLCMLLSDGKVNSYEAGRIHSSQISFSFIFPHLNTRYHTKVNLCISVLGWAPAHKGVLRKFEQGPLFLVKGDLVQFFK